MLRAASRGARSRSPRTPPGPPRPRGRRKLSPERVQRVEGSRAGSAPSRRRSGSRCWSCSTGWSRRSASPSCCTTWFAVPFGRSRRLSAAHRRRRGSSPACARRRVRGGGTPDVDLSRQRGVVEAFIAALRAGDLEALPAFPRIRIRGSRRRRRPAGRAGVRDSGRGELGEGGVAYGHMASSRDSRSSMGPSVSWWRRGDAWRGRCASRSRMAGLRDRDHRRSGALAAFDVSTVD